MSKKTIRKKARKESGAAAAAPAVTAFTSSKAVEFRPDYSYVTKDLRRIGILAGTFMLILVVLSFFLR
jgi:hypothetical protein